MKTFIVALTAAAMVGAQISAPIPTVTAAAGSLPVGATCSDSTQCSNGASCYAVNSMLYRVCGNFQAECTNDSQCAYNTCNQGFCNGFKASTTSSSAAASTATASGTLPLGAQCSSSAQCSNGADCYATNSMLIPVCGNFQASCKDDSQCAFNTCNQGLCNGFKSTTTTSSPSTQSSAATTFTAPNVSQPSVSAAAGSLPLGAACSSDAQCSNGANCYATNFMLMPRCGNFQATCSSDSQCAFNTCNGGLCSGFKPSASTLTSPSAAATRPASTLTSPSAAATRPASNSNYPSAGGSRPATTSSTTTPTIVPSTGGAAPASGLTSGLLAVAFAAWAWML